jgi:hypothetical protein
MDSSELAVDLCRPVVALPFPQIVHRISQTCHLSE